MAEDRDDILSNLVTFSTFILSLNTAALVHLGEIPDPVTQKKKSTLPLQNRQ